MWTSIAVVCIAVSQLILTIKMWIVTDKIKKLTKEKEGE